jgi:membrane protein DedA with SNARE-associated domain
MEIFLQNILIWIESSKYFLLFIGCIFEGPIVMLASGFLYSLGVFSFIPMYLVLVLGNFIADIVWYFLGRFGTHNFIFKYGHFIGITPELLETAGKYFNKNHQKILIITKLTTGFGFAIVILLLAGIFKVPFKKYLLITLVGGFIWAIFLLSIGYFFGNIFTLIPENIKIFFIILMILILIGGLIFAKKYFKKNII